MKDPIKTQAAVVQHVKNNDIEKQKIKCKQTLSLNVLKQNKSENDKAHIKTNLKIIVG
jgi:hypothetical protein